MREITLARSELQSPIQNKNQTHLFKVHQHIDEKYIQAITLRRTAGLSRGMDVYDSGAP
jgi:F-type H+-transporting ATPase subunit beta